MTGASLSERRTGGALLAVLSLVALLGMWHWRFELGLAPLPLRAAALTALLWGLSYGVAVTFRRPAARPLLTFGIVAVAVTLGVAYAFLGYLPNRLGAGAGVAVVQHDRDFLSEGSAAGIVGIGFSLPVFTPTLTLRNDSWHSRWLELYLRVEDSPGSVSLYRAVRDELPADAGLSAEGAVRGMLAGDADYLFLPVALAPFATVSGRFSFVLSDYDDSVPVRAALGRASLSYLLRDARDGETLCELPWAMN